MKNNILLLLILFVYTNYAVTKNEPTISPAHILQQIEHHTIQFVDFWFTDLQGQLREVTLPASQVAHALSNGLSFDGSSIPGYSTIFESDMFLKPDQTTFTILPALSEYTKSARIMCDVYRSEHIPYEGDPRYRLKQAEKKAHALGFEFLVGPELEFFLLNSDNTPLDNNGYFSAEPYLGKKEQKKALIWALKAYGVNVEKLHHEVAPGQHEISIHYASACECADQVIIAKHTIATIAQNIGWHANFMPKPFLHENGSAMHIHFSLKNKHDQTNAFYDENDTTCLSSTAKHFIAGVLKYIQEMSALFNPSINSYERLVPGYEAPVYVCWAAKNRSALIRIPEIEVSDPRAIRAELRSPDATSNPYLAFTILLEAGLAGIEEQLELPPAIEENLYELTQEQIKKRNIDTLPTSLEQALSQFATSNFIHEKLGTQLVSELTKIKNTGYQSDNS